MNAGKDNVYISVSGVMGSGKTTFCRILAKKFGFHLMQEKVDQNPYLAKYYQEPHRWAFKSQVFYLIEKVAQLQETERLLQHTSVVQDTPIYQDSFSYARAQKFLGYMTNAEYDEYLSLLQAYLPKLLKPDLIIHLDAPLDTLEKRIRQRARNFEKTIDRTYLQLLQKLQSDWIQQHSSTIHIITIPTDNVTHDITLDPKYQTEVLSVIENHIEKKRPAPTASLTHHSQ
ncbi:MAG TPA: deoxynucleoside kinase [Candidatus Paceibacterota bacterium]